MVGLCDRGAWVFPQGVLPRNSAVAAGMAPGATAPAAAAAPPRVQIVSDKPLPRQYEYGGDLVRGTQQATQAYIQQVRAHAPPLPPPPEAPRSLADADQQEAAHLPFRADGMVGRDTQSRRKTTERHGGIRLQVADRGSAQSAAAPELMPRATAARWQAAFAPAASPAAAAAAAAPAGSTEDSDAPSAEDPETDDDSLDYAEGDTSDLLFVMRCTAHSARSACAGEALVELPVS